MNYDQLVKEMKGHLDERMGNIAEENLQKMKDLVDRQSEEIKSLGETRDETAKTLEKREEDHNKLMEELAGVKGELEGYQKAAGRGGFGGERPKSAGDLFTSSDSYKGEAESKGFNPMRVEPVDVGGMLRKGYGLTSATGETYGAVGDFIKPQELGLAFPYPREELSIVDRLPVIPTTTTSVEYIQMTGFANFYAELTANAASGATTLQVPSGSMYPGQRIEVGGEAHVVATVPNKTSITIDSGLSSAKTAGAAVTSRELGFTEAGEIKPQANIKFREKSHTLGTIAHWYAAHKQTLSDVPQMRGIVDNEMRFGLRYAVEQNVLYGSGEGSSMLGLMNNPDVPSMAAVSGSASTKNLDHIRKMATKARLAQRPIDTVVLRPEHKEQMDLAKGSDGHYVQVNVATGRDTQLWRLNVVETTAIRGNDVLVGGFQYGAYIVDREQTQILFSDQHSDFFTRNMVAVLCEARLGLATPIPEAFITSELAAS